MGSALVLRLLDKSARLYALPELGMSATDRALFERLIQRTHGIILVTGPTGSGKSTTLYAALQHLDCKEKNILTLEDPIEYQLTGISQMQVSTKKGMTFATGLRAVLRQDPDIIMVGEIRDEETARMASTEFLDRTSCIQHSAHEQRGGCGVASAGSGNRALPGGQQPARLLAQRLVRVVCPHCAVRGGHYAAGPLRPPVGFPHWRGRLSRLAAGARYVPAPAIVAAEGSSSCFG